MILKIFSDLSNTMLDSALTLQRKLLLTPNTVYCHAGPGSGMTDKPAPDTDPGASRTGLDYGACPGLDPGFAGVTALTTFFSKPSVLKI